MVGPLARLRLLGCCCPCLESESDHSARDGVVALQGVPVKWYRRCKSEDIKVSPTSSSVSEAENQPKRPGAAILDGINEGMSQMGIKCSLSADGFALAPTDNVGIVSTLDVVDTDDGPALRITPRCASDKILTFVDEDDSKATGRRRPAPKTVMLRDIGSVAAGDGLLESASRITGGLTCGVKVFGKEMDSTLLVGPAEALLQFDVFETTIHGITRDETVLHLNTLVTWNRNRIANKLCGAIGTIDEDDDHYVVIQEADREVATPSSKKKSKKGGTKTVTKQLSSDVEMT